MIFCKKKGKVKLTAEEDKTMDDRNALAEFVVEEFRFLKSYLAAIGKLFPEERQKYISVYDFHVGKINEIAGKVKIGIVNLEGKEYDEGLPVRPLNLEEFVKEDVLTIEQTIEPSIIDTTNGKILRSGSVILKKKTIIQKPTELAVDEIQEQNDGNGGNKQ